MGAYKENPRYNQVQTRLCDDDYAFLKKLSRSMNASKAKVKASLISAGIKMLQEAGK